MYITVYYYTVQITYSGVYETCLETHLSIDIHPLKQISGS